MTLRTLTAAGLMLALAGCTTTTPTPSFIAPVKSPIDERWVGQSAGRFFASFGPPTSDRDEGGSRIYTWRGGYNKIRIPVAGQAGATRQIHASCKADIVTSPDYTIRAIRILGDVPGSNGGSYCAELLAPTTPPPATPTTTPAAEG